MSLRRLESVDAALGWFAERGVRALTTDSRRVREGDAFIAWPGYAVDGRRFVPQALAAGAQACLVEADGVEAFEPFGAAGRVASLPGLKARTGEIASGFLAAPSERLQVIAVTGTNGKTSTAWWVAQVLGALGRRCGVIGTLGVGEPPSAGAAESITFTGLTTPDPVTLQTGFRQFADAGFRACAIEASSIGIAEQRLAGTRIEIALFTNFTQDHLDYHGSMDAYWSAKAQLFAWPRLRSAVVNLDDTHGAMLAQSLQGASLDVWTYSTERADARLRASSVRYAAAGLAFEVHEAERRVAVTTQLIGDYNVANLLAAIGALRASGIALADAAQACAVLTPVPGRMQRVRSVHPSSVRSEPVEGPGDAEQGLRQAQPERVDEATSSARPEPVEGPGGANQGLRQAQPEREAPDPSATLPDVVVDYAHTPDALEKALRALRPFAHERGGALWCVFGCGGDRDSGKRPLMGALAQRLADRVVVTSDNPRNEAPAFILLQIVAGLAGSQERVKVIEDRRAAIAHAVRHAAAHDVILIAGKGHEDYQEIRGVKHPFSDLAEAGAALAARQEAAA